EDGIRDRNVTGVQTCALPILRGLLAINLMNMLMLVARLMMLGGQLEAIWNGPFYRISCGLSPKPILLSNFPLRTTARCVKNWMCFTRTTEIGHTSATTACRRTRRTIFYKCCRIHLWSA